MQNFKIVSVDALNWTKLFDNSKVASDKRGTVQYSVWRHENLGDYYRVGDLVTKSYNKPTSSAVGRKVLLVHKNISKPATEFIPSTDVHTGDNSWAHTEGKLGWQQKRVQTVLRTLLVPKNSTYTSYVALGVICSDDNNQMPSTDVVRLVHEQFLDKNTTNPNAHYAYEHIRIDQSGRDKWVNHNHVVYSTPYHTSFNEKKPYYVPVFTDRIMNCCSGASACSDFPKGSAQCGVAVQSLCVGNLLADGQCAELAMSYPAASHQRMLDYCTTDKFGNKDSICRKYAKLNDGFDNVVNDYCSKNPTDKFCACSRSQIASGLVESKLPEQVKGKISTLPWCYIADCSEDGYLTSAQRQQRSDVASCPSDITQRCSQVFNNVYKGAEITDVSCGQVATTTTTNTGTPAETPTETPSNASTDTPSNAPASKPTSTPSSKPTTGDDDDDDDEINLQEMIQDPKVQLMALGGVGITTLLLLLL